MMGQNSASTPPGCVDAAAITAFQALPWVDPDVDCGDYPGNQGTNDEQNEACRGGPCWQCPATDSGWGARKKKGKYAAFAKGERFTADHQPPQKAAWYMGGCADPVEFAAWAKSKDAVKPHCKSCSNSQGGVLSHVTEADIRSWM